mgnify:CR=1 FL=1
MVPLPGIEPVSRVYKTRPHPLKASGAATKINNNGNFIVDAIKNQAWSPGCPINVSKAISLWRDLENHHTVLCFSDDNVVEVKETPEEILIKLPVIGG